MMRLPLTLYRYIGATFANYVAMMLGLLLGIVLLFDTLELFRRASKKANMDVTAVLQMSFLKLPEVGQQIVPLAILFGAMYAFWRLTRTHELIVTRAAGVSAWQFLLPALVLAGAFGMVKVGVLNPISSVLITKFVEQENQYFRGQNSGIDLAGSGLWLREADGLTETIIHAREIDPETMRIEDATALFFEGNEFMGRLDAQTGQLIDGRWIFSDAWLNEAGRPPGQVDGYQIPTVLTANSIEESFAQPDQISFWALTGYIETLERTGFSAIRTRLHYYGLLAEPLLFIGMVLIAAAFSLRPPRKGGTLLLVSGGLVTGFAFFFLRDLAQALGTSGTIPPLVAAWIPAICSVLTGIAGLLQSEDG
ncbi:MAG: LPS export ABC transporter permease LptG [Alphaproteobacteria bacterium]|nr:LPS export ABC transporter permease LptG [Alphaproteobacteria bacterium SS10]